MQVASLQRGFGYSFKAWRYPAAYFRQLQNSILIRENQDLLASEFAKIPAGKDGKRRVVRLYVDGDFHSFARFCVLDGSNQIAVPDLAVYGYGEVLENHFGLRMRDLPQNYYLNISSGSKYGQDMLEKVEQLPICTGSICCRTRVARVNGLQVRPIKTRITLAAKNTGGMF